MKLLSLRSNHRHLPLQAGAPPFGPTRDLVTFSARPDRLLLKVDAQGYDYQVLMGAEQLLRRRQIRRLVAELMPMHMPGGPSAAVDMVAYLNRLGYACTRCDGPGATLRDESILGKRVGVLEYASELARTDRGILNRGVNFGRWDDLVCEPER